MTKRKKYSGKSAGVAWRLDQAQDKINEAIKMLYVVSGLAFLSAVYSGWVNADILTSTFNVVISISYIFCAFWAKKKPLYAMILALGIYLSIQVLNYTLDPNSLYAGPIVKLVILTFLVLGLVNAIRAETLTAKLIDLQSDQEEE